MVRESSRRLRILWGLGFYPEIKTEGYQSMHKYVRRVVSEGGVTLARLT